MLILTSCWAHPRAMFRIVLVYHFSDVTKEMTYLLDTLFCIQVGEIEAAISGWSMDDITGYGGNNATFLEGY